MNIYVKELVALSKIDKALDSFNPQIAEINAKVEKAQKKVDDLLEQKENIAKVIEENNLKIASFEQQIEDLKEQLDSIKKKSAEVKTEREISSLSSEEQIAKDNLTYANEEIERLNSINDVKKAELEELESELATAQEELEKVTEEIKSDIANIEEQKAELFKSRDEAIRSMDQKILAFYEKIRNWAGNTAVVKVEKQACYGCYMKINDKAYSDLIKGEDIVTCPHCGRVLYIEVDSETAEA